MINQAQNQKNNPIGMLKEITKNYSPEQINNLFDRAKQFGISDEILEQTKNEIVNK